MQRLGLASEATACESSEREQASAKGDQRAGLRDGRRRRRNGSAGIDENIDAVAQCTARAADSAIVDAAVRAEGLHISGGRIGARQIDAVQLKRNRVQVADGG